MARADAREQTNRRPRVAEVEHRVGLRQTADACALHTPDSVVGPFDGRAEGAERSRRRQHVLAFQQAVHAGLSNRERAEHQRAVGDGLVAGHGAGAFQGAGGRRNQGVQFGFSGAILAVRAWIGMASDTPRL